MVVHQVTSGGPPSPLGKGKGKVTEIRYPGGSEYLRAGIQNAEVVGPSRVEPLFGETFTGWYRPSSDVHVWCPDVLTSYVFQVPNMICFFKAAFENNLCFPLHPFIKRVLHHFNFCPSQLSPNLWGVLIGLLIVFRERGLGVPSIALLLDLFSVKAAAEGFLYISKHSSAKLIILDLPSSHRYWNERYFFVNDRHWEYNPSNHEDTLCVLAVWTTPENLREFPFISVRSGLRGLGDISNFALVMRSLGVRPDLSPEDVEVKRKLLKRGPREYSKLIRSDIPWPSSSKSS